MIIYDGNLKDTCDFDTDRYLKINSCGRQNHVVGQTVIRKRGRSDYHLILIADGSIKVKYKGKTHRADAGNIFIYEPGEPHYYEAIMPSTTLWMHFAGTAVPEILDSMNIVEGVHTKKMSARVFEEFSKLIGQFHQPKSANFVSGTFLTMFAYISDELSSENLPQKQEIIWNILSYINSHSNESISLDYAAKLSGYSRSRFSHLFAEVTGTTFVAYLRGVRMQNACELLTSSFYSIKEIAQSCGFDDPLYFCRIFKKEYGVSPSEYRKKFI